MDAVVISAFTDADSGVVYMPGDMFTGADARVAGLVDGGYLDKPVAKPAAKRPARKPAAKPAASKTPAKKTTA